VRYPVTFINRHSCARPAHRPQERLAAKIFAGERKSGAADIILTGSAPIRTLNRRFRTHNRTTDVLSFPFGEKGRPDETGFWGEVYINLDVLRREAKKHRLALKETLARRVAHGLLHLFGYDHHDNREAARMTAREQRYLKAAGFIAASLGTEPARPPRRRKR
jgi:probable rRNA maturation factor